MNNLAGKINAWSTRHPRFMTSAWIGYWFILTGLLLSPKLPAPPIQLSSKGLVAHFVAFTILATISTLAGKARKSHLTTKWYCLWACAFITYGGLIELIQPMVNRGADWQDLVADTTGALVGILVTAKIAK